MIQLALIETPRPYAGPLFVRAEGALSRQKVAQNLPPTGSKRFICNLG